MAKSLQTPVLLIVFNRPDLTRQVFEQIRKVRPVKLYIAADGHRPNLPEDAAKCRQTRLIADQVDWPCQVKTKFSTKNLGCKMGPYSAMDWLFSQEETGIILEDDILAGPSFFYFCQDLLERYKDDERIGSISGNNFQFGRKRTDDSYYFSRYSQTWGWATWKRVWQLYDIDIKSWPKVKEEGWLAHILDNKSAAYYWTLIFDAVYSREINSAWDYQWTFASWVNNLLSIIPNKNLATNIGIGNRDATHTKLKNKFADLPTEKISLPLKHPSFIIRDSVLDNRVQRQNYVLWKELVMKYIRRRRLNRSKN